MEIRAAVEWDKIGVVNCRFVSGPAEMVYHYINHQIHVSRMQGCREVFEVVCCAEVGVESIYILLPIAMIGFAIAGVLRDVQCDRRYPDLDQFSISLLVCLLLIIELTIPL